MIILDTNVISEPLKPAPDEQVISWLSAQLSETLFLTSITLAELHAGIAKLPIGKRQQDLQRALDEQVLPLFRGRVLAFDAAAAVCFAQIHVAAQVVGNPISFADGAIAAIAAANKFLLATRNVRDFRGTGLKLINPWQGRGSPAELAP